MMTDYRTLLAEACVHANEDYWQKVRRAVDESTLDRLPQSASMCADIILATRIPDLCPDCKGSGTALIPDYPGAKFGSIVKCTHPNAPTIADLLQWGENVAKAEVYTTKEQGAVFESVRVTPNGSWYSTAFALLAALRGEGQ